MKDRTLSLIRAYADGTITPEEFEALQEVLRADAAVRERFLQELSLHAALDDAALAMAESAAGIVARNPATPLELRTAAPTGKPRGSNESTHTQLARWLLAAAAVAIVALITSVYALKQAKEPTIAKVSRLSGSLQWTGDGGRVYHDLNVGTGLRGGTIEGMAPDSWFELEFNDGSIVTISGKSTLTFSDRGQKMLYLKEGNVSVTVKPQPSDEPMLIYTRTAVLEVLGTQFDVEARLSSTLLNVTEGRVRVKRLSDGNTVDVPARHRVVTGEDEEMSPTPILGSVNRWRSQLHLGPEGVYGKWSPWTDTQTARIRAIPYTTHFGLTIYAAALGVSRGDKPPVILEPASRFRVRGRLTASHPVYFGVTLRHRNGEFAGKFQTIRPASEFPSGEDFEVTLRLTEFRLDPSLVEMKESLPTAPFHLVVESMWCHTLDKQAGLEVTEVELALPAEYEADDSDA